jgi:thiol-disulfide isomerase/thioredoxin
VTAVKIRVRLLVGSLLVAVLVSVALGWVIAQVRNDSSGSTEPVATLDNSGAIPQPPSIETNAVVGGDPLPDVAVQTLDGDDVDVRGLIGQPMVINVWSSSCVPCKKELPDFAAAHLVYGDDVRFVGIDYLPPSEREESFARDKGVQYELLYDANGEFISAMGLFAYPVTLFVNADGTVVKQSGQLDEQQLTALIESELL